MTIPSTHFPVSQQRRTDLVIKMVCVITPTPIHTSRSGTRAAKADIELELFRRMYKAVTGEDLNDKQRTPLSVDRQGN